jgi:hypothetical protein
MTDPIALSANAEDALPWYADHTALAEFAEVLVAAGQLTDPTDVVEFVRKPWLWGAAHTAWEVGGHPGPEGTLWGAFLTALDAVAAHTLPGSRMV